MSPRTPTLPPTEPAMWRKLMVRTHPDSGGSHELFIWTGASYKQLAAIGHAYGMSGSECSGWYRCVESIPLSDCHAGHILSRFKQKAA